MIKDPKTQDTAIILDVRVQKNPSIKVKFEGNRPSIYVNIFLDGDVTSIYSTIDYESKELKPLLQNEFKKLTKEQLDKTIKSAKV